MMKKDVHTVGIIADTHGFVHPGVIEAFQQTDIIIHAGDIGSSEILDILSKIAPVVAVRGNMDQERWSRSLSKTEIVEIGNSCLYILHDLSELDLCPQEAGFNAVIFGHSHCLSIERQDGVLFINPGSASRPRFHSQASVALLTIQSRALNVRPVIVE